MHACIPIALCLLQWSHKWQQLYHCTLVAWTVNEILCGTLDEEGPQDVDLCMMNYDRLSDMQPCLTHLYVCWWLTMVGLPPCSPAWCIYTCVDNQPWEASNCPAWHTYTCVDDWQPTFLDTPIQWVDDWLWEASNPPCLTHLYIQLDTIISQIDNLRFGLSCGGMMDLRPLDLLSNDGHMWSHVANRRSKTHNTKKGRQIVIACWKWGHDTPWGIFWN